jgi:glycosyltransferase involved in cell wall biosynthesis
MAAGAEALIVPMPTLLTRLGESQLRAAGKWRSRMNLLKQFLRAQPGANDYLVQLRQAIAQFQPDLVHSNGIKTHLLSRLVVPAQLPLVWHLHDFYGLRPLSGWLLRRARTRVRAGIAIAPAVARDAAQVLPGVPIRTVMNAVDLKRFCPGPGADLDALAGFPPAPVGTVRVGLIATYARWKGHQTFLDAAQLLAKSKPNLPVRWYIIGGPIYQTAAQFREAELRSLAAERALQESVAFVPFQKEPAGIYRGLDIVVHASTLPEPFGLTVAEAMACGRAVVVSAAGGAAELFTAGHDALGVRPGDAAGIAAAIHQLVDNPAYREQLGQSARATAQARFDDAKYGEQLLEVYRNAIS